MHWLQPFNLIGRGKASWVTDLMVAAENHEPVAYIVCFICFIIICVEIALVNVEVKRRLRSNNTSQSDGSSQRDGNSGGFVLLAFQGFVAFSIPGVLFYCLAIRLFA